MQPAAPVTTSAQPSQDRHHRRASANSASTQPWMSQSTARSQFRPEILAITRRIATLDGTLYALPLPVGLGRAGGQQQVHHGVPTMADLCRADPQGKDVHAPAAPDRLMAFRIRSRSGSLRAV